jgi:Phosphotransferase enzyme family
MDEIIRTFGLDPSRFVAQPISSGHIHKTYKLTGSPSFVLQRVNKNVFVQPEVIAENLRQASSYLRRTHPDYRFLTAIENSRGKTLSYDDEGYPWRLFPFIENTVALDQVTTEKEAYSAASAFGTLTQYLDGIDILLFEPTIPQFHDLSYRYGQFEEAIENSIPERKKEAKEAVQICMEFGWLVKHYQSFIREGILTERITHNDTKINNVLLDASSRQAVCVIDLDTLMPGYFIYDIGDMIRTFVSPVSEEEKDVNKIGFRNEIYEALVEGYLFGLGDHLTLEERKLIPFSGQMMTYIMALRMLSDFLVGDKYYHTAYPQQNLVRARNQLRLLEILSATF